MKMNKCFDTHISCACLSKMIEIKYSLFKTTKTYVVYKIIRGMFYQQRSNTEIYDIIYRIYFILLYQRHVCLGLFLSQKWIIAPLCQYNDFAWM